MGKLQELELVLEEITEATVSFVDSGVESLLCPTAALRVRPESLCDVPRSWWLTHGGEQ